MKKLKKILVVFILMFLFVIKINAREITIDDVIEKYNERVTDTVLSEYEAIKKPAIGCSNDSCLKSGFVEIKNKDTGEVVLNFQYDEGEKYILFDELHVTDETELSGKNIYFSNMLFAIGELHGYTADQVNNIQFEEIEDTVSYEENAVSVSTVVINSDGFDNAGFINYLKIGYGNNIVAFFSEYIDGIVPDRRTTTRNITSTTTVTDEKGKDDIKNPSTSIMKYSIVGTLLIVLTVLVFIIIKKIKKVERKIKEV